ncbi:MAG: leucyl aminopeptidase [Candidatus Eisenbacteria bacterium]
MEVVIRRGDLAARAVGLVAIGIFESERRLTGAAAAVDRASGGLVGALLKSGDFRGRWLESALLHPKGSRARRILVLGLGGSAKFTPHRARQVAGVAARRARELGARTLAMVAHGAGGGGLDPRRAAQVAAEGVVLGHWRFTAYRTDPGPGPLHRVEIVEPDSVLARNLAPAVARGARWAEASALARDLASTPGQDLVPEGLAERAEEIGRTIGARVEVLGVPQMERLGMGAILAVGRGSPHPPRFVVLDYDPAGSVDDAPAGAAKRRASRPRAASPRSAARPTVVIVGKGITFDTGGISLKPRENMHKMKYDMSGAAAVLGAFSALPTLALDCRVIGLVASAENMPGSRAFKPGDVVRAMDGTTIEITNTDAEGRLVLADALVYARRYEPAAIVDLATLTGAISIALGSLAAGLYSDDDALAAELSAAGERAGERLWRMPAWDEFANDLRSDTADLVNSSGMRDGGANVAAVFLKRFARGMRWAHLDIASTAWSPTDRPLEGRGPTGFGVRLLLEWLSGRQESLASRAAPKA